MMMDAERWRELCSGRGENVWAMIISLLQFAAEEDPPEFRRRRDGIAEALFSPELSGRPRRGAGGGHGAAAAHDSGAPGTASSARPGLAGPQGYERFVPSGWEAPHAATSAADESGRAACPGHVLPRETHAAAPAQSEHKGRPGSASRGLPSPEAWDPLPQQSHNRHSSQNRQLGQRQGQAPQPQRKKQEQGKEGAKESGKESGSENGKGKHKSEAPYGSHSAHKQESPGQPHPAASCCVDARNAEAGAAKAPVVGAGSSHAQAGGAAGQEEGVPVSVRTASTTESPTASPTERPIPKGERSPRAPRRARHEGSGKDANARAHTAGSGLSGGWAAPPSLELEQGGPEAREGEGVPQEHLVLQRLEDARAALSDPNQGIPELLRELKGLQGLPVSVDALKATQVGRLVKAVSRQHHDSELQSLCRELIREWKQLVEDSLKPSQASEPQAGPAHGAPGEAGEGAHGLEGRGAAEAAREGGGGAAGAPEPASELAAGGGKGERERGAEVAPGLSMGGGRGEREGGAEAGAGAEAEAEGDGGGGSLLPAPPMEDDVFQMINADFSHCLTDLDSMESELSGSVGSAGASGCLASKTPESNWGLLPSTESSPCETNRSLVCQGPPHLTGGAGTGTGTGAGGGGGVGASPLRPLSVLSSSVRKTEWIDAAADGDAEAAEGPEVVLRLPQERRGRLAAQAQAHGQGQGQGKGKGKEGDWPRPSAAGAGTKSAGAGRPGGVSAALNGSVWPPPGPSAHMGPMRSQDSNSRASAAAAVAAAEDGQHASGKYRRINALSPPPCPVTDIRPGLPGPPSVSQQPQQRQQQKQKQQQALGKGRLEAERLEQSKRRLQESYLQIEKKKKAKTIQVLESEPKQAPCRPKIPKQQHVVVAPKNGARPSARQ